MLPPELIDYIFYELGSQICDFDSRSLTALKQCAKSSRSFRDRARRYIFANVTVTEQDTHQKVDKIRGIVDGDPNVVNYFQEFTILLSDMGYLPTNASGLVHVLNIIATTLGCNGLKKLTISTTSNQAKSWPAEDNHYDFNQALCAICEACIPRRVDIYNLEDIPTHILAHSLEVRSFSTTSLFINNFRTNSNMVDIFKNYPPASSHFSLCKWKVLESEGLYKLCLAIAVITGEVVRPAFGNLEHMGVFLESGLDRFALDLVLMSAKNTLRTLKCVISAWRGGSKDIDHTIDMGIMSFPKLQTLHLQFEDIPRLRYIGRCNTLAESILILRPETWPFKSLSSLEILWNVKCDRQRDLDEAASHDEGWTLLDALITGDRWQALHNVHFGIKVGTFLTAPIYCKSFNFDAFNNFLKIKLPRASGSKTLSLTITMDSVHKKTRYNSWMATPVSTGHL